MCEVTELPLSGPGRKSKYEKRYYYLRDTNGHPLVTICLLSNIAKGRFARGVAICSPSENVRKPRGKGKALKRALDAAQKLMTSGPIRREEALETLHRTHAFKVSPEITMCKSTFMSTEDSLTNYEKRLIHAPDPAVA